jgi:hypothetical protein
MSTLTDRGTDLTGWYWHPGAQQPVYLFWQEAAWRVRWYEPPETGGSTLDEPLTPGVLHDLLPLGDATSRERKVGA